MRQFRNDILGWIVAVTASVVLCGCEKKQPASDTTRGTNVSQLAPAAPAYSTLASVRWIGKEKFNADTNSAYLRSILEMPETARLLQATHLKLAQGPWLKPGETNDTGAGTNSVIVPTNGPAGELYALLGDIVENDGFCLIRGLTNAAPEWAVALRLPQGRAEAWKTNQSALGDFLKWVALVPEGSSNQLSFSVEDGWSVFSWAPAANPIRSAILAEAKAAAAKPVGTTNTWVEAELDLGAFAKAFALPRLLPSGWPKLRATIHGEGDYVRFISDCRFEQPLNLKIEPWTIPTNIIRDPIVSFTAVQSIAPWLEQLDIVKRLQLAPVPNQFFFWALNQGRVNTLMAAPWTNIDKHIERLGPQLETDLNAWLTNHHAMGAAEYSATNQGINWIPVPLLTPTVQVIKSPVGSLLVGRLAPALPPLGRPAPPELFERVLTQTNLVYYDWEITEARILQWIFMGQSFRLAFDKDQLPPNSRAMLFLDAVGSKLGNCVTECSVRDASSLHLVRKSHSGFTGLELHALADWLESPEFPRGTYSLLAPPAKVVRLRAGPMPIRIGTNLPGGMTVPSRTETNAPIGK